MVRSGGFFGGFGGSSGSELVIIEWSVDSGCHELSENLWFVWSKTSYSGDKWRCYRCGTREDSATQLLICVKLSLAICTSGN